MSFSSEVFVKSAEKGNGKTDAQVATIHTNERVPGHPAYYEKGGLRTYGDDEDHDHEPPVHPPLLFPISRILADGHNRCPSTGS
jgi:hypothetical protein